MSGSGCECRVLDDGKREKGKGGYFLFWKKILIFFNNFFF